jgi:hypothetical protein
MAATPDRGSASFRARTCIAPDRIAALARDVGESIRGPLPGRPFIRFEGARPGRLTFTIRSWGGRAELMSFCINIFRDQRFAQHRHLFIPFWSNTLVGYAVYRKYAWSPAKVLQRFDPHSVGILMERRA